jgi:hypothetical protein
LLSVLALRIAEIAALFNAGESSPGERKRGIGKSGSI